MCSSDLWITELNQRPGVRLVSSAIARIKPTLMAESLQSMIEASAQAEMAPLMRMASGAGHDAMVVGHHLPAGMIFIPSIGGRSHDIVEDTSEADIVLGCEVMIEGLDADAAPSRSIMLVAAVGGNMDRTSGGVDPGSLRNFTSIQNGHMLSIVK